MNKHLFILCSHSSGSTALWRLLQTSPHVSALPREGQVLETVAPIMRKKPWDPDKEMPWPMIKAYWNEVWDLNKPILLEKSPPNLLRAFDIERNFEESCFIVLVRSPYAYCEGTRRRGYAGLGYVKNASYQQIAEGWIRECQRQIENLNGLQRVVCFTYEEFAENTQDVADRLLAFLPELERLDVSVSMDVHSIQGMVQRPITNLNHAQIMRLSDENIAEINRVLKRYPEIMSYFHYDYLERKYSWLKRIRLRISTFYVRYVVLFFQRGVRRLKRSVVER